jgi:hypothetical protein
MATIFAPRMTDNRDIGHSRNKDGGHLFDIRMQICPDIDIFWLSGVQLSDVDCTGLVPYWDTYSIQPKAGQSDIRTVISRTLFGFDFRSV